MTTSTSLAKKQHQTLVAYSSGGTLTTQILADEEGEPSRGNAKVRVFNTATAEIGRGRRLPRSPIARRSPARGAAPFAASLSGLQSAYTQIAASATPLHVCVTAPGDKSDLRLDIPSLTLSDQRIVTIVLVRTGGGFLLNGLLLDQQSALDERPQRAGAGARRGKPLARRAGQRRRQRDDRRRRPDDAQRRPVPGGECRHAGDQDQRHGLHAGDAAERGLRVPTSRCS